MNKIVLPEIIGIGVFDAAVYFRGNKKITDSRKTSMFEIELPLDDGGISYIDESKTKITTDTIICAKPNQMRHTQLPFKCLYIHMIVKEGAIYDVLMGAPSHFITKQAEKYKTIFIRLCKFYDSKLPCDVIALHGLIMELTHMIFSDTLNGVNNRYVTGKPDTAIENALNYINENFMRDIDLKSVAASVPLSPVYFHHKFKSETGKTPNEYITEKRLEKAVDLLSTTEMSLSQIAYECGFSSQSYFNYVFKKNMHFTPREYMHEVYKRYADNF